MERRMAAAALLISVFVAGALVSAGVMVVVQRNQAPDFVNRPSMRTGPPRAMRGPRPGGPRGPGPALAPMQFSERLVQRLDLSEPQQEQVAQILERRSEEAARILDDVRPRLEAHLDSANSEIRDLLTPEQRELFDRFVEEGRGMFERRRGRMMEGRPDGPP